MLFAWDVGRMVNRSPGRAVGGTVFLAANDNQFRFGLRGRHRTWMGRRAAFDLAPGAILFHSDNDLDIRFTPGVNLLATVGAFEWLRFHAQVEYVPGAASAPRPSIPGRPQPAPWRGPGLQLGMSLGSHAGAVVGLALPALFILAMSQDSS